MKDKEKFTFHSTLCVAGQPSRNGLVFTQDALEHAVNTFYDDNTPVLAYIGEDETSFASVALICTGLELHDNRLNAHFSTLPTKAADKFMQALLTGFNVGVAMGWSGSMTADKVVENCTISHISIGIMEP